MTDKEIIIDGVDVAGCEYLTENLLCNQANLLDFHCVANQNCHYKQLQRTQQQYNAVVEQNRRLQEAIKAKEQNCEELSKQNSLLREKIRHERAEFRTSAKYSRLQTLYRYKQALEKIEQIANTHTTVQCLNPDYDCTNCHDDMSDNGKTCINNGRQEILAVISEVKK